MPFTASSLLAAGVFSSSAVQQFSREKRNDSTLYRSFIDRFAKIASNRYFDVQASRDRASAASGLAPPACTCSPPSAAAQRIPWAATAHPWLHRIATSTTSSGRRVLGGARPRFHQPPSQTREIHQNHRRNGISASRAFSRHSFHTPVTSVARTAAAAVFPTCSTNHF